MFPLRVARLRAEETLLTHGSMCINWSVGYNKDDV
jgi:hypothetical protein